MNAEVRERPGDDAEPLVLGAAPHVSHPDESTAGRQEPGSSQSHSRDKPGGTVVIRRESVLAFTNGTEANEAREERAASGRFDRAPGVRGPGCGGRCVRVGGERRQPLP